MEFSRQESWSGWLFPSPGYHPNKSIEPWSLTLQVDFLLSEPGEKLQYTKLKRFLSDFVQYYHTYAKIFTVQKVTNDFCTYVYMWHERKDYYHGFPGSSTEKETACNAGDHSSILRLGRSPGEGNRYPLQCCGLENSMDRGAWQATVHGVTKNWTGLSDFHFSYLVK